MRALSLFAALSLLLLCCSSGGAWAEEDSSHVVKLTTDTYDDAVRCLWERREREDCVGRSISLHCIALHCRCPTACHAAEPLPTPDLSLNAVSISTQPTRQINDGKVYFVKVCALAVQNAPVLACAAPRCACCCWRRACCSPCARLKRKAAHTTPYIHPSTHPTRAPTQPRATTVLRPLVRPLQAPRADVGRARRRVQEPREHPDRARRLHDGPRRVHRRRGAMAGAAALPWLLLRPRPRPRPH